MRYLLRFHGITVLVALLTLTVSTASTQAETDSVVVSPGQLEERDVHRHRVAWSHAACGD